MNYMKQLQEHERSKTNILGISEEPLDQNRELAWSSGSVKRPSDFFCLFLLEQSTYQDPLHFFINHH